MNDSHPAFAEASNLFDLDEATPIDWPCSRPAVLIAHERKALRDRFSEAGPTSLPDQEILELILFRAMPRKDVKPLAKELLEAFGDFTLATGSNGLTSVKLAALTTTSSVPP